MSTAEAPAEAAAAERSSCTGINLLVVADRAGIAGSDASACADLFGLLGASRNCGDSGF